MTNREQALALAEKAKQHAEAAGTAANDVDIKARVGLFDRGTEPPTQILLAAQAHAFAAQAFREAAQAYLLLGDPDPVS